MKVTSGASKSGPISYNQPDTTNRGPKVLRLNYFEGLARMARPFVFSPWGPLIPCTSSFTRFTHRVNADRINYAIVHVLVRRASLPYTGVRDVREIVGVPARSSHQAGFLQFQWRLGRAHLQRPHCFRILRGERHGVSCVEKGEIISLLFHFRLSY